MTSAVLVTGGGGYLGSQLVAALAADPGFPEVIALDIREVPAAGRLPGVRYLVRDIRSPDLVEAVRLAAGGAVVHLASIVTPSQRSSRAFEYSVDVEGTRNLLDACVAAGVRRLVVTSSGAAYGYHPDNPEWINEDTPLRGNRTFAYAWHKRLVEEMLADRRERHPELGQVVLRVSTILGDTTYNQITALFRRRWIPAVRGGDSRFVFVWDQDVVGCIVHALRTGRTGIYNVAGDGAMTLGEIAKLQGARYVRLPAWLLRTALGLLRPLGLSRYGPEQVDFIRWRPVLDNARLKREFGYHPRLTSRETFDRWRSAGGH